MRSTRQFRLPRSSQPRPWSKLVRPAQTALIACAACAAVFAAAHADDALRTTAARIAALNPHLSPDDPRELPMKFRSLRTDAYTFFRGTADLYYDWCRENAADWLNRPDARITLHGDVHLGNVGVYRTAESSDFVRFGVVDLDESFAGPIELDVMRGIASLRVAATARKLDVSAGQQADMAQRFCGAYTAALRGNLDAATLAERHPIVRNLMEKVRDAEQDRFVKRYLREDEPPRLAPARRKKKQVVDLLETPPQAVRAALIDALPDSFRRMSPASRRLLVQDRAPVVIDAARWTRLGSSGSQGVTKYLVLALGTLRESSSPMLFEFKEQPRPAAERAGLTRTGLDRGSEVAAAHAALQRVPNGFVSHATVGDTSFLVRTMDPWSEEPEWEALRSHEDLFAAADMIGETLGHAHRHALNGFKPSEDASRLADLVDAEIAQITRRAAEFDAYITRCFEEFQTDPSARRLADRADAWLARAVSRTP